MNVAGAKVEAMKDFLCWYWILNIELRILVGSKVFTRKAWSDNVKPLYICASMAGDRSCSHNHVRGEDIRLNLEHFVVVRVEGGYYSSVE